VDLETKMI